MKQGTKRLLKVLSASLAVLLLLAAPSVSARVQAAGLDITAPGKPSGLAASSVGQTTLTLRWSGSADNVGVTSYAVFCNYSYLTYSVTTQCAIRNLSPNTAYTFYVAAQDAAGNISGKSNIITVRTASPAGTGSSTGVVTPAPAPAPTAAPVPAASGRIVSGYYAGWAAYSGYTPSDIPAANLTHVIYAFANISAAYQIMLGDSEVDPGNLAELKALKGKYPKLRTLVSVGGWTWSGRFSDMAATSARRDAFSASVVSFLRKYGLDGVDLDWEYPVGGGLPSNSARVADKTNFSLLLQSLRSKLNAAGSADGKRYLLTIAGGADTDYVNHVYLSTVSKYVDFATVMTYDMHGGYDRYTDFNAPLYAPSGSPQEVWSCDQAVNAWTSAGFPKSKLVLGVPFYGHLYSSVQGGGTGIFKPYSGMKTVSYDQIAANYLPNQSYIRRYGASARTPWLFNGSTFITYEDPRSLSEKAAYVKAKGLAGAGIWELSENASGALLSALSAGLK